MPKYKVFVLGEISKTIDVECDDDSTAIETAEHHFRKWLVGFSHPSRGGLEVGDLESEIWDKEDNNGTCEYCGFETHLNPQLCLKLPLFD